MGFSDGLHVGFTHSNVRNYEVFVLKSRGNSSTRSSTITQLNDSVGQLVQNVRTRLDLHCLGCFMGDLECIFWQLINYLTF